MDIATKLARLGARRRGLDRIEEFSDAQAEILSKRFVQERWEQRASNQPHTRYALGAMQEVGPDYTRVSLETANRVAKQLKSGLDTRQISAELELQGSVPLNVHIRGVSDVDLLVLRTRFLTYTRGGVMALRGDYYPTTESSLPSLIALRRNVEELLESAFPRAKVDKTGAKAVKISGGSLPRQVDVVPAHWHDGLEYQASGQKHYRGVTILDKSIPSTVDNLPFLHMKRISDRCEKTGGGLRKAIRLLKTIKADAREDDSTIDLPSFDLASMMYHADKVNLGRGIYYELAILAETQRHVAHLTTDPDFAKSLMVPDNSRPVFNTQAKLASLPKLGRELDQLVREVAIEQNRMAALLYRELKDNRQLLENAMV